MLERWKSWASYLKRNVLMLWFARQHPDMPASAKILAAFTVAYALSPIDLIPDFIPVLGYLDDLLILPVLIWLTLRLLPHAVLHDSRARADAWIQAQKGKPRSRLGAIIVVMLWLLITLAGWLVWQNWS